MGKVPRDQLVNERIRADFPNIGDTARITSPETNDYNCVAWAIGITDEWWEGGNPDFYYWPPGIPTTHELGSVIAALEVAGFKRCEGCELEPGFDKIAVCEGHDGEYSHVSKLLSSGKWSSKLGVNEDIEHDRDALLGPPGKYGKPYGVIKLYMKRPTQPGQ